MPVYGNMSVRAPTFASAQAARSTIANLFFPNYEGRRAFCANSGVTIDIGGRRRLLKYDQFADVLYSVGWFWGAVTVVTTDDELVKVSGLPKAKAKDFAQTLAQNYIGNVQRVAAFLAKDLDAAALEIARFDAAERYMAAHMILPLLATTERLTPLLTLSIKPKMLSREVEAKVKSVTDFIANHEQQRMVLNEKFVEAEIKAMKPFFDAVESNPLTLAQSRAVVISEDRNLVVAAAGSGKTSVIVAKAGYLIRKALRPPEEILMMAFGRQASNEMAERISERIGASVTVKTFHALGLSIIASVEAVSYTHLTLPTILLV